MEWAELYYKCDFRLDKLQPTITCIENKSCVKVKYELNYPLLKRQGRRKLLPLFRNDKSVGDSTTNRCAHSQPHIHSS